ncbi:sarcosine oxidase subunit gamma family protein [Arvimicrobium flavum]|uniref:sarcosine oxidase subunit gamma family protein n=1 Tax=Arvimicrobium flavum TaxID=3393320 RepID=UPI00237A4A6D|nr:sarcosine oxidase subunit gamma family protein [Mesorhizobium shangrilense]
MVDPVSPLGAAYRPGPHGNIAGTAGVVLSETQPGSIVQLAAWHGEEKKVIAAIKAVSGLKLPDGAGGGVAKSGKAAFGFAPGKFLLVDEAEGLAARYAAAILHETGSVTDLSHGRTAIRIAGPKAEWVLSKFFAIDFALTAFPLGAGRSTMHHDIFAQIQRTAPTAFDLYVFRSLARSFWKSLCHGAEEVGYEVM